MSDDPQIWLEAQSAAKKELVMAALLDPTTFDKWWRPTVCSIVESIGEPKIGTWFKIKTISDGDDTGREYVGQVLDLGADTLAITWRGRDPDAVRVDISVSEPTSKQGSKIDARISGVSNMRAARRVKGEWRLILKSLAGAWGAP